MFQATTEQKVKYQGKINGTLTNYDEMIKKINPELLQYGLKFYDFSNGKLALDYINQLRSDLIINLKNINQGAFSSIVEALKILKEDYVKEVFPVTQTIDKLELDFIEKELSVMTIAEMEEFYKSNFLDQNKVRLFDIEIKRRENLKESSSAIAVLKTVRDTYCIEDEVTQKINEWVKLYDGYRQVSSGAVALIEGLNSSGQAVPKFISHNQVVDFTEKFYQQQASTRINILDLIRP